jgi:hypothetical protein
MTFINEGGWDRVIRIVAGIALICATWMVWPGAERSTSLPAIVSLVLLAVGAVALVTGLVGWCPAYTFFGISTKGASHS